MLKLSIFKLRVVFVSALISFAGLGSLCFKAAMDDGQWLSWSNKCLTQSFNADGEQKLKKWELNLTDQAFVRLRKTYASGKQEYYSFQLHRFKDVDYLGTTINGTLQLKTLADDIIVQTYDDPKGNIDSMATTLNIPVKNMDAERLDSLRNALMYFKEKKK